MSNLKALFGLAVVVAFGYIAWMVLPAYYSSFQFQDFMDSEAKLNSYSMKPESEIQEGLFKKAKDLELPLASDAIHVQRSGTDITIWAEYTVKVDLPIHPIELKFSPSTKNKRI